MALGIDRADVVCMGLFNETSFKPCGVWLGYPT